MHNGGIFTHTLKNILLVILLKLVGMLIYMVFDVAFHNFYLESYGLHFEF